ncbi:hypothetical protein BMR07_16210 [Methylococcaceae bacterium CS1]|nr:hypothetical protein BMR07_16210 [Methylococcaceae bacterium CS1]
MILKKVSVVCLLGLFSSGVMAGSSENYELSIPDSALGLVWERSGDFPVASTPYVIDGKVQTAAIAEMGTLNSNFEGSLTALDAVFWQAKFDHSYMTKASSFWNMVNNVSDRFQESMNPSPIPTRAPYPYPIAPAPNSSNTVASGAVNKPAVGIGSDSGSDYVPPESGSESGLVFSPPPVYSLGDVGPAGGLVFIVSSGGIRGMEVQGKDLKNLGAWGCLNVALPVTFGDRLGSGMLNNNSIRKNSCFKDGSAMSRTKLENDYRWHLPSASEFRLMSEFLLAYSKKSSVAKNIGHFGGSYWTSTQYIQPLPLRDSSLAVAGIVPEDSSLPLVNPLSYVPRSRTLKIRLIRTF